MNERTRRHLLSAAGLGIATGLAGCLFDGGEPVTSPAGSPTERPTTDDTPVSSTPGNGTQTPGDETQTPANGRGVSVVPFAVTGGSPAWYEADENATGFVDLFASERAVRDALDFAAVGPDRRDEVEAFVERTDFYRSRLLSVESVGPNTCYSDVAIDSIGVAGDEIVGHATATDPSQGTSACGEAITFPSVLVRVTADAEPPNRARVTVTDGWGRSSELSAAATADVADLSGYVRPDGAPPTVPAALDCEDDDFRRHPTGVDESAIAWGETPADGDRPFAIRVNETAFERGDEVVVTMTNVGDGPQGTGNRHKYNLQVKTEAGWQDVRGSSDGVPFEYTDEGIAHQPGDGFQWRFDLTEAGVVAGHVHEDRMTVCPGLPAGRYRFCYWEPAVAVAFDLVE